MQHIVTVGAGWLKKAVGFAEKEAALVVAGVRRGAISPLCRGAEPADSHQGKVQYYSSRLGDLLGTYYAYVDDDDVTGHVLYAELTFLKQKPFNQARSGPAVDVSTVCVELDGAKFRLQPKLLKHRDVAITHFKKAGGLRQTASGEWENNTALRIESIDPSGSIKGRIAQYFDQVATNLTLDWASGAFEQPDETIRCGIEKPQDGKLPPLQKSKLANTLGTSVLMYNADDQAMLRYRKDDLGAIRKKGLHCTASGVFEVLPQYKPGMHDFEFFRSGMEKEIHDEMGLSPDQYLLVPLAFARELPRGGKPQLFWVAFTDLDDETLAELARNSAESNEFVIEGDRVFEREPEVTDGYSELFTYEGFANLQLAQDFVSNNEAAIAAWRAGRAAASR